MATKEDKIVAIIRKNTNYSDAYTAMMDIGFSSLEADEAWNQYQDQCGLDL